MQIHPHQIILPCGTTAKFCYEAGHSYRCNHCGAVAGSVAQPKECVIATNKYEVLEALGSNVRWNYDLGYEEVNDE
jgi:hypothetical protein